jgi:hypothetical protein
MGINANECKFETFDLMKDIELARHSLENVRNVEIPDPKDVTEDPNLCNSEIPLV